MSKLKKILSALPAKASPRVPIRNFILIEGNQALYTNDIEAYYTFNLPWDTGFRGCIPLKDFKQAVASSPDGVIIRQERNKAVIESGDGVTRRVDFIEADEYPTPPTRTAPAGYHLSLDANQLEALIKHAAGPESNSILSTIHLEPVQGAPTKVAMAATDGSRLIEIVACAATPREGRPLNIEAAALKPFVKLGVTSLSVDYSTDGPGVHIVGFDKTGDPCLTVILKDYNDRVYSTYPKYKQLIPPYPPDGTRIQVSDVGKAYKWLKGLPVNPRTNLVLFDFASKQWRNSATLNSATATGKLPDYMTVPDERQIAFNRDYLIDTLQSLGSDTVTLELGTSPKAGHYIHPVVARAGAVTALLMPVHVR